MMAKITKGGSFGGCVDYVTRRKKDLPDGTPCGEWRIIDAKDVPTEQGREEIIASFEDNRSLNPRIRNPVGHISLNFHANDKDKINDASMVEIARKYMDRMGIADTPYIVVRHLDKDYPHCHIVFSRVNNHAETISDKNDFERNRDTCRAVTEEYGLHISEGKKLTKVNRLRGAEKLRYEIFNAVEAVWNNPAISSFPKFEETLKAFGIGVEYKLRRGTDEIQGLSYTLKGKKFPASKIDRRFSYGNLRKHFKQNLERARPRQSQSEWVNADGSIAIFNAFRGVKLTAQQKADYTSGKTIRLDGCRGDYPTVYIRFDSHEMKPKMYSSDPDAPKQADPDSFSRGYSSYHSTGPVDDDRCTITGGSVETFQEFRKKHPDMGYSAALQAWKAKRRGQNLNGGFRI